MPSFTRFRATAVLGAILITGYLGGAVATHLHIGDPFFGPIIPGVLVWVGLYLRDARLRHSCRFEFNPGRVGRVFEAHQEIVPVGNEDSAHPTRRRER